MEFINTNSKVLISTIRNLQCMFDFGKKCQSKIELN